MPPRNLVRAFLALWWTLGLALLIGSVQTAHVALASGHHASHHLALLGIVEAVSAILFLIPSTMRAGAAGLLLSITIAFAVHATLHQFRWDLLVYGAAVTFVLVHGPLSGDQRTKGTAG